MAIFGQILNARALESLSRPLTTLVLENIARISTANVLYDQAASPRLSRRKTFPPRDLSTGLYDWDAPESTRYIFPGIATVLEGKLQVRIGQSLYLAQQGDWLIFQPNVPHQEFCLPTRHAYRLWWFSFPPDEFRLAVSRYSAKEDFHIDGYCALRQPPEDVAVRVEEILRHPGQPVDALQRRLVHLVSWWLHALDGKTGQPILHLHPLIEKINALLENPQNSSMSVTDLSKQVGLSLNYVSASFHRHTGRTLHQVIQEKRIERARQFLTDPSMPIKEIAILLGYADSQHFNHAFRRLVGTSPSAFRQQSGPK